MSYTREQIASALDYAVLKPTANIEDIKRGAAFCVKHKLASFCVASANVPVAVNGGCPVASVIGFPHGNMSPLAKYYEADQAMTNGAVELDVVVNYGRYLGGDLRIIDKELTFLCAMADQRGVKVKAILETCHYTTEQIIDASRRCITSGVDWLKTSTGFGPGGATPMAVSAMIATAKDTDVEVKASGGIKTYADVVRYLDLGCTRLGASRFLELLNEQTG
jgi:deoxyribose-phosphate aldolase